MDRKFLILLIVILVLVVFPTIYFYSLYGVQENIRNDVLKHLEQNLEFCEIVNDDIDIISNSGLFWLNCNGGDVLWEHRLSL